MIQMTLSEKEFEEFLNIVNDQCPRHFGLKEFVSVDECDELCDTGNCKECWKKSLRVRIVEEEKN